jgi:hypothetical protein
VSLRLLAAGKLPAGVTPSTSPVGITLTTERRRLPAIGLGCSSGRHGLTESDVSKLRALRLCHLRTDIRLDERDWPEALESARAEAAALGLPLELAVHLPAHDGGTALDALVGELRTKQTPLSRIMVFRAGEKTVSASSLAFARSRLAALDAPIGAGTDADFYQLNQFRPPHEQADFVNWSMNPQVHAFDLASIAETSMAVPAQLESARKYFPAKPLVVSPITLKPRFNPVATAGNQRAEAGRLPPQVDERQLSPFAAAWTLAMLSQLAEHAADSVTLFETVGWRGVMGREAGSELPRLFPSRPRQVFPLYYALAAVGEFREGRMMVTKSTDPIRVISFAIVHGDVASVWLANLTAAPQTALLSGFKRVIRRLEFDWNARGEWMFEPEVFLRRDGLARAPCRHAQPRGHSL